MGISVIQSIKYRLSEHPTIVGFRWSPIESWGSTWSFLITSISTYIAASVTLHFLLLLLRRRRPVSLGPIPTLHSLTMALISATIFLGMLSSAAAEIRDTRWFWRRSKTPLQWLLCFPLGTRPSGRVFFWSYIFYLSRFLHIFRTFFTILRRRKISIFQICSHSILICMSFLWLEFSQSFQVLAILSTTLVYSVVFGYRFWTAIGLPSACFPIVANCKILLVGYNMVCHLGVILLHFSKGGCNGIGAWVFNAFLNGAIILVFLKFYVEMCLSKREFVGEEEGNTSNELVREKES